MKNCILFPLLLRSNIVDLFWNFLIKYLTSRTKQNIKYNFIDNSSASSLLLTITLRVHDIPKMHDIQFRIKSVHSHRPTVLVIDSDGLVNVVLKEI